MKDLSDKNWHDDDDSIHEIYPEFSGETFYQISRKATEVVIMIKFGEYINGVEANDKKELIKKSIDTFHHIITKMGLFCLRGVKEDLSEEIYSLFRNDGTIEADSVLIYEIRVSTINHKSYKSVKRSWLENG